MAGRVAPLFALLFACFGSTAFALGLGEIELQSGLNQPLKADIPLLGVGSAERDGIKVQIASPEDFSRVGLERASVLGDVHFQVTEGANEDQSRIHLSTSQIVREPYLS